MASPELVSKLIELVNKAGSTRKASELIKSRFGAAPTHSAISKAMNGASTDFIVSCYIDALENETKKESQMATKVVAIANQKGGVGKTTVAVNFGLSMAALGKKCLFLDIDPQNNLGETLASEFMTSSEFINGTHPANNINMFDWKTDEPFLPEPFKVSENVYVIGSSKKSGNITNENIYNLADSLDLIKGQFDYVFVDSPPTAGMLQHAALSISDAVLIVSQPQALSVKGVDQLMTTTRQVQRRLNPHLKLLGVLINLVKRPASKNQVENEALLREKYGNLIFPTNLYDTVKVSEALELGQSLAEYSSKHADKFGFTECCEEFITRLESEEVVA
ncbi:ParA family protein [Vibrio mediterranei]|uniref:ParA family protein n=1 Tax=Vibrio mediterranei TaxID=689 RepID=UPI0020A2EC32|nr:ParA family protein [Vibrio mediterranei]